MRIIGNDPSTPRQAQIVASGTLSTGDAVVVNSDGTVSVVAENSVSEAVGSAVTFEAASVAVMASVFDSNSNKVVVAYADGGNSNYGTAVVGTVSGTSVTFGTPVVFETGQASSISATFDSANNKVVIAYFDNNNSQYGTAVVGDVSGTSISFGSPTVFRSGASYDPSVTFDSTNGKVVLVYRDQASSQNATARVCTISGTTISFGSAVVFNSGAGALFGTTFDTNSGKVVVAFSDSGNSNYGTAIVGTVSGTSISFGTKVAFTATPITFDDIAVAFDSTNNKVVFAYANESVSFQGTAIVGTVSGTSISFGSEVVFNTASSRYVSAAFDATAGKFVVAYRADSLGRFSVGSVSGDTISFDSPSTFEGTAARNPALAYDAAAEKVFVAYNDHSNTTYGRGVVVQPAYTDVNLTAENYIGTAVSGAPDGTGAKINLKGAVDENQSGLTAGQSYYVQTDGTLSTTAGDLSVFAGTAVAANKLIVKG